MKFCVYHSFSVGNWSLTRPKWPSLCTAAGPGRKRWNWRWRGLVDSSFTMSLSGMDFGGGGCWPWMKFRGKPSGSRIVRRLPPPGAELISSMPLVWMRSLCVVTILMAVSTHVLTYGGGRVGLAAYFSSSSWLSTSNAPPRNLRGPSRT